MTATLAAIAPVSSMSRQTSFLLMATRSATLALGHGLGKIVTEIPSNAPGDQTVLQPGMVLTIEPSVDYDDMAHEENIVITDDGVELISPRAPREIPVIDV